MPTLVWFAARAELNGLRYGRKRERSSGQLTSPSHRVPMG